jgi:hypothetical protein
MYLKLSTLFYTDDTVVMAATTDDLQKALVELCVCCSTWNLNVNLKKTKVLVFSKGKMPKTVLLQKL